MGSPVLRSVTDPTDAEQLEAHDRAVDRATKRMAETNAQLEERIASTLKQNQALARLINEQEAYLAEVEAQVARMEERRRDWRRRYSEVTGRALEEPVALGT